MNWKQQWIDHVLAEIPTGSCRKRMEAELCDHLETQCSALMESGRTETEARAEALRTMGEPDKLREEYRAVWRRTLPGRLETLVWRLCVWVAGCGIMGAWFLHRSFCGEAHPTGLVTVGLLAAWAGEKTVIIGLSALIYQMPLGLDLLTRICSGGDPIAA